MFEHLFLPVTHGTLGLSWHSLPALYMLNSHLMAMTVVAFCAVILLFILMPVLRKRLATVLVVSTCLITGFLMEYSFAFPDWQVAYTQIPHEPLCYHEWFSLVSSPVRLYNQRLGLHIGLQRANITLLASPIAVKCPETLAGVRFRHVCFPELRPKGCPAKETTTEEALTEMQTIAPNPLSWDANQSSTVLPNGLRSRRLFSIDEEIEDLYTVRRMKPLHFARSAANDVIAVAGGKEGKDSFLSTLVPSSVPAKFDGSSSASFDLSNIKGSSDGGKKTCLLRGKEFEDIAWFDETIDLSFGRFSEGHLERKMRGLPASLLTLSEYLSRRWNYGAGGGEGMAYSGSYDWALRLRYAGHFTAALLGAAMVLWLFSLPLQMAQPECGALLFGISGVLMAAAAPLYAILVQPSPGDALRVSGVVLNLQWGGCFYSSLFGGIWAASIGFFVAMVRHTHPGAISTDLDLDELKANRPEHRPFLLPGVEVGRYVHEFT